MIPIFKQFLQAKTYNTEKKSYYQRYDVKRTRAFHKQEMTKQKVYRNILARKSGMDYSAVIHFQSSLFNVDKEKALTKNIQQGETNQKQGKWCRCGSIEHLQITSNYCPVGISYRKAKKLALEMGLSLAKTNKAEEYESEYEEGNFMVAEASGVDKE